jgi:hypothetical protein
MARFASVFSLGCETQLDHGRERVMTDDARVQQLLEEILDSDGTRAGDTVAPTAALTLAAGGHAEQGARLASIAAA